MMINKKKTKQKKTLPWLKCLREYLIPASVCYCVLNIIYYVETPRPRSS